jgi:hypothetical protein
MSGGNQGSSDEGGAAVGGVETRPSEHGHIVSIDVRMNLYTKRLMSVLEAIRFTGATMLGKDDTAHPYFSPVLAGQVEDLSDGG